MSDSTTAALQALLKQVENLTTTVTDQAKRMDGLHSQNERLLDQVKDAKREREAPSYIEKMDAEDDKRDLFNVGLERHADGTVHPRSPGPAPHTLTREQARDPATYRAAKEAAKAAGVELKVDRGQVDPTIRNAQNRRNGPDVMQSTVFTLDDTHERVRYVRADMEKGPGFVNRRMQAERDGYTVKTFRTLEDMPDHVQTKFNLMEREANASNDAD